MSASAESMGGRAVVAGGRRPGRPLGAQPDGAATATARAVAAPAGGADAIPARAGGLELLGEVAGSGHRRAPALVRRADGQTVQLTPLLFRLLEAIDGRRGYGELAEAVSERIGRLAGADQLRYLAEAKLRPLGLLRRPDGSEPVLERTNPLLALRFKVVVSNAEVTNRVAAPFAALYHPPIVLLFLLAFGLTTWWVAFEKGLASAAHQAIYEPSLLLLVFALTLLSAGFHELGHAAACRYSGAKPGVMGVGLYLVWPAFYTDVTDSYRLSRRARLRVDLGGLYFNAIFGVAVLGLWTLVGWDALLLVIAAQLIQMARQLVPVVRFDGYHVLADLTGVPDLFAHIKPTLAGMLPTRWGRPGGKALVPWARAVVTLWVLAVVPLLGSLLVLIVIVLPRIAASAWDSLGLHWQAAVAHWTEASAPGVTLALFSMLIVLLPAVGFPYLVLRVARRVARWAWRATTGRPVARAGAVLGGAVLVAAVGWTWWPDGQYRPIDPAEHWRLPDVRHAGPTRERAPEPAVVRVVPVAARGEPDTPAGGSADRPAADPPAAPRGSRLIVVLLPTSGGSGGTPVVAPAPVSPPSSVVTADDEPEREPVPEPDAEPPAPAAPPEEPHGMPPAEPIAPHAEPEPSAGAVEPTSRPAWPFPFAPPREPRESDNQVLVVNVTDGSTAFDAALALVWVTDDGPVEHRNESWALASCKECRTVAVAFQVVLVVGYAQVVTPVNAAAALNYECETCLTHALAVQLVATLSRQPSEQAMSELAAVWSELEAAAGQLELLPLAEVYAQLLAVRAQILAILALDGDDPEAAEESAAASDEAGAEAAEPEDAVLGDELSAATGAPDRAADEHATAAGEEQPRAGDGAAGAGRQEPAPEPAGSSEPAGDRAGAVPGADLDGLDGGGEAESDATEPEEAPAGDGEAPDDTGPGSPDALRS